MTALRALSVSALTLTAALLLAGCSGAAETASPDQPADAAPAATESAEPAPADDAAPTPVATTAPLTCTEMIPASVSAALTSQGWQATEAKMYAGQTAVEDSLVCTWAPDDAFAGQMYGVGRVTDAEENQMRSDLTAQGWVSEEAAEGVYFSAPVAPAPTATDATTPPGTGGGMDGFTYLFGDGWVKYSDTRDGTLLIVTPIG